MADLEPDEVVIVPESFLSDEETNVMARENILSEIASERKYQDAQGTSAYDDTKNDPWMWTSFIALYSSKWMNGTYAPLNDDVVEEFRNSMVKAAALAVAAIESIDRQRAEKGYTFYEKEV